jgi:Antibiotic biosynthesis monooxygenase
MFIAMNRFRVTKGSEAAFEHVWLSRDSHLDKVPGFIEFHLLKGPEAEAYPVDSGLSRCSMLSDRIGAVARADADGEGAVARGIPKVVSR